MNLLRLSRKRIRMVKNKMKHKDYWRKRFELLEQSQNRTGAKCLEEVEKQYRIAQRTLEGEITKWYQRFAQNNGITMQQARQMLNAKELEELKWDVQEYIRHGKENAVNEAWMIQLENASARYHISRLESLKLQVQHSLEVMFGNQLDSIDAAMRKAYKEGYYKTAYEIQKGIGVGWDFTSLDERKIGKVIKKPWAPDGKNFSKRIWNNREKLVNELHTELSRNIITGQDPQKAINTISRKMKVSKSNARRIVMTELAFFSSAAQGDCFRELGVEQFEIVATLDSHTSEICQEMDGKHFPMSQYEAGITAPPFHVWCRSCTCPYFDDDIDNIGKRAARGENGKTYYVPGNMNYAEWKEIFVDKGNGSGIMKEIRIPEDILKANGMTSDIAAEIKKGIAEIASDYEINLSRVVVEDLSRTKPNTPYLCRYTENNGKHEAVLVLNKGFDFSDLEAVAAEGYKMGYFAGRDVKDHIVHELAHVMTGQHIQNANEFKTFIKTMKNEYIPGISGYSDEVKDGFETIAEAFVKIRNGEEVPEKARKLVRTYIERWRKK